MDNTLSGAPRRTIARRLQLTRRQKKGFTLAVIIVVAFIIIYTLFLFVADRNAESQSQTQALNSVQDQLAKPVAVQNINKTFDFNVNDKTGKKITTFQYKILDAELRNEVVINGQKYHPVAGKTFLVLSLQITNNYTQDITIQPQNYVRIMLNNSAEKLAPDLYNEAVDVQAIATKPTSIGLAMETSAKNIKLQVGEITGNKTIIPVNLQYK